MIFDDTYGTVQGNDDPSTLVMREPYKVTRSNTTFLQPIGNIKTISHVRLCLYIGVVLFALLALGHVEIKI